MSYRSVTSDSSEGSVNSENAYCVFMHIVEGIGLQRSKGKLEGGERHREQILLLASLNNVKFEIEGHSTETVTIFNSNCIWECALDDVRRMKTDNRPVRIECFLNNGKNSSSPLKLIGTLLLPIRGLPTLNSVRNYQPKFLWHKLGSLCADWRPFKPEIYLLLIIAKKSLVENEDFECLLLKKPGPALNSPCANETNSMLQSQSNVYVQLLDQVGLIQVGNNPDIDCDIFQVTLTLKCVKDLATLIEIESYRAQHSSFVFMYELLGSASHTEIPIDASDCYVLNDKISLKFKSSLKSLRLYFQRIFYIPINIYFNGHAIANYRFDCSHFLPNDSYFDNKRNFDRNSHFYFDHLHKILSPRAKKPSVEFNFSVQLVESHFKKNSKELAIFSAHFSPRKLDNGAGGDNINDVITQQERQKCLAVFTARNNKNNSTAKNKCYNRTNSEPALKYKKHIPLTPKIIIQRSCHVAIDTSDLPKAGHNDVCVGSDNNGCKTIGINTESTLKTTFDTDTLTLKAVKELEAWKAQQMDEFLNKLSRKEQLYLQTLENNWKKQQFPIQAELNAKVSECIELKAQLELANTSLKTMKHDENSQKIQKLEEKTRCLEAELKQQQRKLAAKQQEVHEQQQEEKTKLQNENYMLKKNITQLEQKLMTLGKTHFPAEQLKEMIIDLREQTARFAEVEKQKNFFEEKYVQTVRELKKMKLTSLKQKELKLKTRLSKDDLSSHDVSFDERSMEEHVSKKTAPKKKCNESLREMLFKQSDASDVCDMDEDDI